jgi:hypothetical protein
MLGIYRVAAQVVTSRAVLSSTELVSSSFILTRAAWTPFQTHSYSENLVAPGIKPGTSGFIQPVKVPNSEQEPKRHARTRHPWQLIEIRIILFQVFSTGKNCLCWIFIENEKFSVYITTICVIKYGSSISLTDWRHRRPRSLSLTVTTAIHWPWPATVPAVTWLPRLFLYKQQHWFSKCFVCFICCSSCCICCSCMYCVCVRCSSVIYCCVFVLFVLCLCVMCVTCLSYCCTTSTGLKPNCSLTNIY